MKRLLIIMVILLIVGNTLSLIALTTNVSSVVYKGLVISGPTLTLLSVIGILSLFYYSRKRR